MTEPAAPPKPSLLELMIFCESEIDGIKAWEEVWRREGKQLLPGQAARLRYLQQIHKILELVKLHERSFASVIKLERAKTAQAVREAPKKAPPEKPAEPEPPQTESPEPESEVSE